MMYLHGRDRRGTKVLIWATAAIAVTLVSSSPAVPTGFPEWKPFGFRGLGLTFDVPPGFELTNTTEDGRGATFQTDGDGFLAVWGTNLRLQDFKAAVQSQLGSDEAQGWNLSYRRIAPTWASYSGTRNGRIRYVRAIAVCGNRAGFFQLDYDLGEKLHYDPIVVQMVKTLKPEGC